MKVLMLGWEFSPVMAGGLGVACRGLTEGLTQAGIDVLFLLPRATGDLPHDKVRVVGPQQAVSLDRVQELARQSTATAKVRIVPIPASLHPYGRPPPAGGCSITAEGQTQCHSSTLPPELQALVDRIRGSDVEQLYGCDLFGQVQRFALLT
ncbi:MAG: glycogen/starch synthase, partial [Phycisphaerae bacterium]